MCAWFNKKRVRAMAEMAANLKAESQARAEAEQKLKEAVESKAEVERKIKAEAEKLLLEQFNKYNALVERAEMRAKEAMAGARAQIREAEEKVLAYEVELAKTQESLEEARELMKSQAIARAKAEESLVIESERRKRIESELEEAIAAADAKAQEQVEPMTDEKEKTVGTEGQAETKIIAEEKEPVKTEVKKQQEYVEHPAREVYSVKCVRQHFFNTANLERKFILLLVIAIFSAITFAFSINEPPADEPGSSMIKETAAAPALNYKSEDDVTESKIIPAVKTNTLMIWASPALLKITASAGFMKNIVRYSDNHRLETKAGSNMYYEFSDVSIPADTVVKSAILFIEHYEEEQFSEGKLEWTIGTGRPGKPVVWAAMKAPVHEGESAEAVDAWDITSVAGSVERINSLQLQVNNNNIARRKTFVDYAYVVVGYH